MLTQDGGAGNSAHALQPCLPACARMREGNEGHQDHLAAAEVPFLEGGCSQIEQLRELPTMTLLSGTSAAARLIRFTD